MTILANYFQKSYQLISIITRIFLGVIIGLVYRPFVFLLLKYKHGDKFIMLKGFDSIWAIKESKDSMILILFLAESIEHSREFMLQKLFKHIERDDMFSACPKLGMRRKYSMGYYYLLKENAHEKLAYEMRPYKNLEDVKRLLGEYSEEPLGKNNDKLFEVIVGTKPMKIPEYKKVIYPLICKVHHSLGDGISISNCLINMFAKSPLEFLNKSSKDVIEKVKTSKKKKSMKNIIMEALSISYKLLTFKIHCLPFLNKKENHFLHGKLLSRKKNLVYKQDLKAEYIKKIKDIKKRFKGVSFNNIILAATAASFNEIFLKHSPHDIPDHILFAIVVLPAIPEFSDFVKIENNKIVEFDMQNKFIMAYIKFKMNKNKNDVLEKLFEVKYEIDSVLNSIDPLLTMAFFKIVHLIPVPIFLPLIPYFDTTGLLSNLPITTDMEIVLDSFLREKYFWPPNPSNIGISLSILTTFNCVNMALTIDKAILPHEKDCEEILSNIFKYIDELDEKSKNFVP